MFNRKDDIFVEYLGGNEALPYKWWMLEEDILKSCGKLVEMALILDKFSRGRDLSAQIIVEIISLQEERLWKEFLTRLSEIERAP